MQEDGLRDLYKAIEALAQWVQYIFWIALAILGLLIFHIFR